MEKPLSSSPIWYFVFFVLSFDVSSVGVNCMKQGEKSHFGRAPLQEKFSWKHLDWAFPSEASRRFAISSGQYISENALPFGIEIWGNKLFVTVPRMKNGIPATLNYISLDHVREHSPKLMPYPNWYRNAAGICGTSLFSVYRIYVDKCDRLWVLDSGTMPVGNKTVQMCPSTLNIFDLRTDRIIRQYSLPLEHLRKDSLITNIVVDLGKGGCNDAFAYMPDETGYGLVVYDWRANTSWRFSHSYFQPDPLATDFNVGGVRYQLNNGGISGMALSPITDDGYRILFFHPVSSKREFAVSTKTLRSKKLSRNNFHDFQILPERHLGHSTSEIMNEKGLMLFTLVDQNAIGCWSATLPFKSENFGLIAKHDEALIYPSDIKVIGATLWIISNRMPIFTENSLDYNDVNFRILTIPLNTAVMGTICKRF